MSPPYQLSLCALHTSNPSSMKTYDTSTWLLSFLYYSCILASHMVGQIAATSHFGVSSATLTPRGQISSEMSQTSGEQVNVLPFSIFPHNLQKTLILKDMSRLNQLHRLTARNDRREYLLSNKSDSRILTIVLLLRQCSHLNTELQKRLCQEKYVANSTNTLSLSQYLSSSLIPSKHLISHVFNSTSNSRVRKNEGHFKSFFQRTLHSKSSSLESGQDTKKPKRFHSSNMYDNRFRSQPRFTVSNRPYDKKIFVYGKDDRLKIFPPLLRKFPYSTIVRLSTGCTGTLVTPFHVLTAAHCVHDGRDFKDNLEMLKVQVPESLGVREYYIQKIGIPGKWLAPKALMHYQSPWDYAVVHLSYGVHGRSEFLPLSIPTTSVLSENLHFLGFPNSGNGLWQSVCPAKSNMAMSDGNLILTQCDSAVGNSGAAVLAEDPRRGNEIIGVLSSTMPVGRMTFYSRFSIIAALTPSKLYDICAEIGPIGERYGVCPPLQSIPKPRRSHLTDKVIPFFG